MFIGPTPFLIEKGSFSFGAIHESLYNNGIKSTMIAIWTVSLVWQILSYSFHSFIHSLISLLNEIFHFTVNQNEFLFAQIVNIILRFGEVLIVSMAIEN